MSVDMARRRFLRGGRDSKALRPPWLLHLPSFTDDCTRCGKCIELCPQHILCLGDGGFPIVDFSLGECTFCGACTRQCEADLFYGAIEDQSAWHYQAEVGERCLTQFGVMCRSCEDACEPQAIRFPLQVGAVPKPVVNIETCTGCGACIALCPERAIEITTRELI